MTAVNDAAEMQKSWFAEVHGKLAAPVGTIVGQAEALHGYAEREGLHDIANDTGRIDTSARMLHGIIERLDQRIMTEVEAESSPDETLKSVQAKLRDDLRNPLNAIRGYCEFVSEELEGAGEIALKDGLEDLLKETERVLGHINALGRSSGRMSEAPVFKATRLVDLPATDSSTRKGAILAVDDNEMARTLLIRRLEREGHEVLSADSGKAAIDALENNSVDMVLLDMIMPDMNGLEILRVIKGNERLKDVPVIIISGLDESDITVHCLEAGASDYLHKPINPYELMASVSHWLGDVSDIAPRDKRLKAEAERSAKKKSAGTPAPAPDAADDASDAAVFDPAGIEQLTRDYGEAVASEVVDNFHNISAGLIDDLLGAAQSGDMSLWHRAAHDLKGGARTLGFKRLSNVCREIEFACGNKQPEAARQGTDGLKEILDEALAAMAEYRESG